MTDAPNRPDVSGFPDDPADLPARLENMRPGQVRDAAARKAPCLLPVGALPGGEPDRPAALTAARAEALERLAAERQAVLAPPVWCAPSADGGGVAVEPFHNYLRELLPAIRAMGFQRVEMVPLNPPGGDNELLRHACALVQGDLFNELWREPEIGTDWWNLPDEAKERLNWQRYGVTELEADDDRQPAGDADDDGAMLLERMSPRRLADAAERGLPCLLATGVIENHGNQNPIGCDAIEALGPVLQAAREAPAVVAPTIWYGPTGYAVSGPALATVSLPVPAYFGYADGVLRTLIGLGFRRIIVVHVHQGSAGPQWRSMSLAAARYRAAHRDDPGAARIEMTLPPGGEYDHAGRNETSWMLHLRPDCTRMDLLRRGDYVFCWRPGGEAEKATAERGREMTDRAVAGLVEMIRAGAK